MNNPINPWRTLVKGIILYLVFETALVFSNFNPSVINIYSLLNLKRERFPFSTAPNTQDRALDVGFLDTMFASHIISSPKNEDEYRLIILGDSAAWGAPLPASETLSSQINKLNLKCGNKTVVAYNLGYPLPSAIKDIMILDKAMQYSPDQILWTITLQTFMTKQVDEHPLLETNPHELENLNIQYRILTHKSKALSIQEQFQNKNLTIYRTLRYQTYVLVQFATGVDQIQNEYTDMNKSLTSNLEFGEVSPPTLDREELNFKLVEIFHEIAGDVPVTIINEPILILQNVPNSDLRYNTYFPRWIYDQYRDYTKQAASDNQWNYLDYWDAFPAEYFADTPLHLNRQGEKLLALELSGAIQSNCQ